MHSVMKKAYLVPLIKSYAVVRFSIKEYVCLLDMFNIKVFGLCNGFHVEPLVKKFRGCLYFSGSKILVQNKEGTFPENYAQ